jgi:hypothetical protein
MVRNTYFDRRKNLPAVDLPGSRAEKELAKRSDGRA